ncbi:MAG: hypothetical protein FJ030_15905 [Chloroflexi bacterium]|nr:hypothetical protein [Chloroflexota bacterium]
MLWYQFGPFEAYDAVGRSGDVLALTDSVLSQANNIEEAYYWRGRARLALGDPHAAADDWRTALRYNRNYLAPARALAEQGLTP